MKEGKEGERVWSPGSGPEDILYRAYSQQPSVILVPKECF